MIKFKRASGILLHPTSLPGKFGIGDLGPQAFAFVDFLKKANQSLWQVFPLGPTGYGDSPYQCFSAFAGNPLLISPEQLLSDGLLRADDLKELPQFNPACIDYGMIIDYKKSLLQKSFSYFKNSSTALQKKYDLFCEEEKDWLDDFALFMSAKDFHNGELWTKWSADIALRKPGAIAKWTNILSDKIAFHKFIQFIFFAQWSSLKSYANQNEIQIIGDLPIFIAYDSADLWANKNLFTVDENGKLLLVAGVPPDYFSPTGQLWGNPLYRWDEMQKDDYLWWRKRIKSIYKFVDIARIDHFRGFEAYWQIPGDALTAEKGEWIKAPGDHFFSTIKKYLGELPIIAEDLGLITPEVTALRDKFNFPGMKILQFAFGKGMEKKFLPHNHVQNCAVYTGSHDNDTTRGYFEKAKNDSSDIYKFTQNYLNYYGEDLTYEIIRSAFASVSGISIIPMQDVLNLGTEARMNFPGKLGGNWCWRFAWGELKDEVTEYLKYLSELYDRNVSH